jgi:hypothetical protein
MGEQDEKDRQSVALYGYKTQGERQMISAEECRSGGLSEKNLFTLSKECLNCSG